MFGSVWLCFGSVPGPFGSVSGVLGGVGVGSVRGASVREKNITTFGCLRVRRVTLNLLFENFWTLGFLEPDAADTLNSTHLAYPLSFCLFCFACLLAACVSSPAPAGLGLLLFVFVVVLDSKGLFRCGGAQRAYFT